MYEELFESFNIIYLCPTESWAFMLGFYQGCEDFCHLQPNWPSIWLKRVIYSWRGSDLIENYSACLREFKNSKQVLLGMLIFIFFVTFVAVWSIGLVMLDDHINC